MGQNTLIEPACFGFSATKKVLSEASLRSLLSKTLSVRRREVFAVCSAFLQQDDPSGALITSR